MIGSTLRKLWQQTRSPHTNRRGQLSRRPLKAEALEDRLLLTIDIVFDYTYDDNQFFAPQARRDTLEAAAAVFENRILDDLTAITPGGQDTWSAVFPNPSSGSQVSIANLTIPADTIIVYVGAQNLTSGLGLGGPGGFSALSTPQFLANLQTRGETGVAPNSTNDTDFSLWGGSISFDSGVPWNFSLNEPVAGENDFYSVAVHELGHVLGFGTSDSFRNKINTTNNTFTGTEAVATFGAPIPMHVDEFGMLEDGHYAANTMGTIPGTTTMQESAMDPQITTGTRKAFTDIDWAALDDLGWDLSTVAGPTDYGDAPDASAGTGAGNYQTRLADGGPGHVIVSGLFIGTSVDGDDGTLHNSTASADDGQGTDDEDFLLSGTLFAAEGQSAVIDINVTNTVGNATLYGWIDFNQNGIFEPSEGALAPVPNGTNDGIVTLTFTASATGTAGSTFARFRLSTDSAAASPTGAAADGEVEDHQITVLPPAVAFDPLPLFNWSAVTNATQYELEVTNLSTGLVQISQPELVTNSFRPHEALPVGVFSWRQRAFVGGSFQPWSSPLSFAILETGGEPFISDPVASSVDSLPTFAWSPVENATRYELWVNGTNKQRAIHQTELTTTSFTPRDGLPADTYTAWVRAFNGSTVLGNWSSPFNVTLNTTGTSTLTEPIGSSTNTAPTFGWLPMNVLRYTLQIDNLTTATNSVVFEPNLTGTSYTLPSGLAPGSYRATITGLGSTQSQEIRFQVESVTGQAQFTQSSGRSENPLPTFTWTSVDTATRYELWVDDLTNGLSRVIHSSSLTDTAFKATKPLPPSRYRAWVRAFNGTSVIGTWSQPIDYVVRESSAVPTVWGPIHETQNAAPTFAWSFVTGATHYELELQDGTSAVVQTQQFIGTNSLTLMDALEPGTYVSTVRAYNGATLLGTDSRRFFITTNNAGAQLFGPEGNTTSTRPTFTWSGVDSATRYILWVNDDTRNINRRILESNLLTTSFTPDDALLPGDYRAWVRAYNGAAPVGPWTFASLFTVTEVTGTPSITAPVPNTSSTVPTITWTSVAGAASYEIEVDNVTTAQNQFITEQGITTTTFWPAAALEPGQYRIRVRSIDGGGTPSAFSSDFTLTIESATNAVLVSPTVNSSTASADLLFAWTSVAGTGRYELWVNNLSTSTSQVIYETNLQTISFKPTTNLPAGDYRAWVRAIAADGTPGEWSTGVNFTLTATIEDKLPNDLDGFLLASIRLLEAPATATEASSRVNSARSEESLPVEEQLVMASEGRSAESSRVQQAKRTSAVPRTSADADYEEHLDLVLMDLAESGLPAPTDPA